MEKITIIKLGGSLITDKSRPMFAREKIIARLAKEIKIASLLYSGKLLIGHGSGSFGHASANKYQTQKGIVNKTSLKGVSEVSDVASQLTKIVIKHLRDAGLAVVAFAPGSFIVSDKRKEKRFFVEPIKEALRRGVVPLVYGDVVFDQSQGFGIFSTEKVIDVLVKGLSKDYKIERIVYLGITDGVYDETGKTIPVISPRIKFSQSSSIFVPSAPGLSQSVPSRSSPVPQYSNLSCSLATAADTQDSRRANLVQFLSIFRYYTLTGQKLYNSHYIFPWIDISEWPLFYWLWWAFWQAPSMSWQKHPRQPRRLRPAPR